MDQFGPSTHYIYGEVVTALALVGSFLDYIPKVAALVAVLWYIILITESRTGAAILARLRIKREANVARIEVHTRAVEAAEIVKEVAVQAAENLGKDHT